MSLSHEENGESDEVKKESYALGIEPFGRKALFTTIVPQHERLSFDASDNVAYASHGIIEKLAQYDGKTPLHLPSEWEPLVSRLSSLIDESNKKNSLYEEVWNEFQILSQSINKITAEYDVINGQYQDIHEKYNALLAEVESEQAYLTDSSDSVHQLTDVLVQVNPGPVAVLDADFCVLAANDVFSELYGIPAQDIVGMSVHELGILTMPTEDLHKCLVEGAVAFMDPVQVSSSFWEDQFTVLLIPVHDSLNRCLLQLCLLDSAIPSVPISEPVPASVSVVPENSNLSASNNTRDFDEFLFVSTLPIVVCDADGFIQSWSPSCTDAGFSLNVGSAYNEFLIPVSPTTADDVLDSAVAEPALVCSAKDMSQMFRVYTARLREKGVSSSVVYMLIPIRAELHKINPLSDEILKISDKINEHETKTPQPEKIVHRETQIGNEQEVDVIIFSMGSDYYAMDVSMVREVVEMVPITPVPRSSPHLLGISNLRGEVTHVIDLPHVLGVSSKMERDLQKIIVLPHDQTGGAHIGIIVDNVLSVTAISVDQIEYLGNEITEQIQMHIKGIIKMAVFDAAELVIVENEQSCELSLIIWLDMPALIASVQTN